MTTCTSSFISCNSKADQTVIETNYYQLTRIIEDGKTLMKKSVRKDRNNDCSLRASLRKEYETGHIVSQKTPFVVNYLSFAANDDECYALMDYIDGYTLEEFITSNPDYFRSQANLRRFLVQLLSGLDTIHQAQIIHLDLKPENIMMTRINNDVRIIDFGMCYSDTWSCDIGTTEKFASPELLNHSHEIDARTDLFSVGKIVEYILQRINGKGKPFKPSRDIRTVVDRCLKPCKRERWQSAAEAKAALTNKRHWELPSAVFATMTMLLLAILFINRRDNSPITFTETNNVRYEVISEDSATCRVKRLDTLTNTKNIYIHSHVSYNNKEYMVTEIGDSAFLGTKIETISFPSTLRHIGASSFQECKHLLFIDIPDNVQSIGHTAFWGCTAVRRLRLSKSLKVIPSECFSQIGITDLYIPEGVKVIEFDAFGLCDKLENASLPQSLETIGRGVFWNCKSLGKIAIPSSVKEIGTLAFAGCTSLTDIYNYAPKPQNVMSIFSGNNVTIHVPRSSIGHYLNAMEWKKYKITGIDLDSSLSADLGGTVLK